MLEQDNLLDVSNKDWDNKDWGKFETKQKYCGFKHKIKSICLGRLN